MSQYFNNNSRLSREFHDIRSLERINIFSPRQFRYQTQLQNSNNMSHSDQVDYGDVHLLRQIQDERKKQNEQNKISNNISNQPNMNLSHKLNQNDQQNIEGYQPGNSLSKEQSYKLTKYIKQPQNGSDQQTKVTKNEKVKSENIPNYKIEKLIIDKQLKNNVEEIDIKTSNSNSIVLHLNQDEKNKLLISPSSKILQNQKQKSKISSYRKQQNNNLNLNQKQNPSITYENEQLFYYKEYPVDQPKSQRNKKNLLPLLVPYKINTEQEYLTDMELDPSKLKENFRKTSYLQGQYNILREKSKVLKSPNYYSNLLNSSMKMSLKNAENSTMTQSSLQSTQLLNKHNNNILNKQNKVFSIKDSFQVDNLDYNKTKDLYILKENIESQLFGNTVKKDFNLFEKEKQKINNLYFIENQKIHKKNLSEKNFKYNFQSKQNPESKKIKNIISNSDYNLFQQIPESRLQTWDYLLKNQQIDDYQNIGYKSLNYIKHFKKKEKKKY